MNFFQHQDQARRKTGLLVCYFLLAIIAIVIVVHIAFLLIWHHFFASVPSLQYWLLSPAGLALSGFTVAVMLFGSLRKFWQLRNGGVALAQLLNAQRVDPASPDPQQRQLVNVVEEMSLASGIPVPQLFVLRQESAINAFVAGFRPSETVLVVTQGSLDQLNRDELQGVIAHEFSHIFNADMRLNLRLLATLAGILALGKVGEFLIRSQSRRHIHRRSSRNNGGSLAIGGVVLMVVGYVGLFFGRLIKSAISRQRELLADASAVQFTRDPGGLAGALTKIRNQQGSLLDSLHAEDMSHMCFGETLKFNLNGLLATHPPLDERLQALGPRWLTEARAQARRAAARPVADGEPLIPSTASGFASSANESLGFAPVGSTPAANTAMANSAPPSQRVGTVQPEDMAQARQLIEGLPANLHQLLHQPEGAEQVLYALLASVSRTPPRELVTLLDTSHHHAVLRLCEQIRDLGARLRLPIVELALPTLKARPESEQQALLQRLQTLIEADQRQTLFEWALLSLARAHLGKQAGKNIPTRFHRYAAVAGDIQRLFSALSWASGGSDEQVQRLFAKATHGLLPPGRTLLPLAQCGTDRLEHSLQRLQALNPLLKGPLLDAGADLAAADGQITVQEAELLRTVAVLLDCPLPAGFRIG